MNRSDRETALRMAGMAPDAAIDLADAVTVARADAHVLHGAAPAAYGLAEWNFDPAAISGSTALATGGTVYASRITLREALSVTNVVVAVQTAGDTLTSGRCFIGLYDSAKALIGTSASQHTAWASTGVKTAALASGPFDCPAGDYYVAFFFNGTTGPALARGFTGEADVLNLGAAAADARHVTADTGKTTALPAALGTLTAAGTAYWVGLS